MKNKSGLQLLFEAIFIAIIIAICVMSFGLNIALGLN